MTETVARPVPTAGRRRRTLAALLAALLATGSAGCQAATSPASTLPQDTVALPPTAEGSLSPSAAPNPSGAAAWMAEPLTDVRTGLLFRIEDLAGHVVFLEGMATWCPPCLDQQIEARQALAVLAATDVVYLSVDIDPREPVDVLRAYVDRNGFAWQFAVASPAFLRELADALGSTVLSPPSTPIVVIDRDGHATLTEYGIKRADRLVELARALGR